MEIDEILKNKLQRIASIKYQVIEKAVVNDFNYGAKESSSNSGEGIKVSKKGKEIKEALQKEYSLILNNKVSLFKDMGDLVEKIGENPQTSYKDDYIVEGWEGKIELPKKYAYDQIYSNNDQSVQNYNTVQPVPSIKEMQKYNELSRKYIILSIELKTLSTLIANIDENKTFKLSVNLAAKLGF